MYSTCKCRQETELFWSKVSPAGGTPLKRPLSSRENIDRNNGMAGRINEVVKLRKMTDRKAGFHNSYHFILFFLTQKSGQFSFLVNVKERKRSRQNLFFQGGS